MATVVYPFSDEQFAHPINQHYEVWMEAERALAAMPCHERSLIERFFSKLKHFRRVATSYDKLAANFLVMVQPASMRLWLRGYP